MSIYRVSVIINCILVILLVVFCNMQPLFYGQDSRSRIAEVEYQGQARNTRIFERKPLINTSYSIRHRLELKYFHLAQNLLIADQASN